MSHGASSGLEGDLKMPLSKAKFAMWLFLATEIMFFAGLLGTYIVLRAGNPGVFGLPYTGWDVMWWLPAINTVVLITSSFTMVKAVSAVQKGSASGVSFFLLATALLGCVFMAIKFYEYGYKFDHGIYPSTNVFYTCYFLTTGLHGLHVAGGIVVIFCLFIKAMLTGYPRNSETVEIIGLYWHFVDLVWIYLFPLVYLL